MTVPVFQCVVQDSDAPQHFLFFFRFHTGTARYARLVTHGSLRPTFGCKFVNPQRLAASLAVLLCNRNSPQAIA